MYHDDEETQEGFEWEGSVGRLHTALPDCHPTNHDPEKRQSRHDTLFKEGTEQLPSLHRIGGRRGTVVVTIAMTID